jgi:pSer/pThr/pTyr-binding forkhead associated (FHA) protein
LTVVRGHAANTEYVLDKPRVNIGRMAELTDSEHRIVRRNDVVFEDGADEANGTVSRSHAHIRCEHGEYRICDDESEFGTRIFRDGRGIDVPAGNRRGEKLRPGDEIYLGRACVRFDR